MKQSQQKPEPAAPKQASVVLPPAEPMTRASFTARELDMLRRACRDSDNEHALRCLNAGLARGGK